MTDMALTVIDRHVYVPKTESIRWRALSRNAKRTDVDRYAHPGQRQGAV